MEERWNMSTTTSVELLSDLNSAFTSRRRPRRLTASGQLSKDEALSAARFENKTWRDVTLEMLREDHEVLFWLSPEAFCYYLPGVLSVAVSEDDASLDIYDTIIYMLDRTSEPAYWDDFFVSRWTLLSPVECEAVRRWVDWFMKKRKAEFYENTQERVEDVLALLRGGVTVIRKREK